MSARGCGCNQDGTLSDWHELTWKRLTPEVYLHLQVKVRCENSVSADKSYMSALTFTKNGQKDPSSEERVIFCSPTALSKVRVDVLLHLWNLLMDINGCRSEKEEMQQKPFFSRNLWKSTDHIWFPDFLWQHLQVFLTLKSIQTARNSSWGNCYAFKIHLLEPWLWLLFLYKHTHTLLLQPNPCKNTCLPLLQDRRYFH